MTEHEPIVMDSEVLEQVKSKMGPSPFEDFIEQYNEAIREGFTWGES